MAFYPLTFLAFIGGLGPIELVIILVIILLIFGPMKLPQIGDALGKSVRHFRKGVSGSEDEPVDVTPEPIEEKRDDAQTVEVESQVEKAETQDA
jgi:sec-independent protein translocase protein TatA